MKYLILLLLSTSLLSATLWAQDDIQSILERDPFDPKRGQSEEVEVEEEEAEEDVITPEDLPVLDGTIIMGDVRIAMFSFSAEGQDLTARVEMKGGGSDYVLYIRQPKEKRGEATLSGTGLGEPNGRLGAYRVAKIAHNQVELLSDAGGRVPLEMFVRDAKSRGGSKKEAARDKPALRPPRPEPSVAKANEEEPAQTIAERPKNPGNNRKPTFRRRVDRGNMSDNAEAKKAQIKKKF